MKFVQKNVVEIDTKEREVVIMTVQELVEFLKDLPAEMPVAYRCCSEKKILDKDALEIRDCKLPRDDGWIHDTWRDEENVPKQKYLVFPGN